MGWWKKFESNNLIVIHIPTDKKLILQANNKSEVILTTCYQATINTLNDILTTYKQLNKNIPLLVINKVDKYKRKYNFNTTHKFNSYNPLDKSSRPKYIPKEKVTVVNSSSTIKENENLLYFRALARAIQRKDLRSIIHYTNKLNSINS